MKTTSSKSQNSYVVTIEGVQRGQPNDEQFIVKASNIAGAIEQGLKKTALKGITSLICELL